MNLSLAVGVLMLGLKITAYFVTGSSAILSDAAESVVHVIAVGFAAFSLQLSFKPADKNHPYGHAKISFFSAGFEGALIGVAALGTIGVSIQHWVSGDPLRNVNWGVAITFLAAVINGALGTYLVRFGRHRDSLIIEANGRHVLTDCWTSGGVLLGIGLTTATGWMGWDSIFGILVACSIIRSSVPLVRQSVQGLLDEADPSTREEIEALLDEATASHGIRYHELRHRRNGDGHWIDVHLLFPEHTTVGEAHRRATEIERLLGERIKPFAEVQTHLEPLESHDSAHSTPTKNT